MSRPLTELLRAAPRASLLPGAVLRRAAELEAACARRAAATPVDELLADVRAGAAGCLGLPAIERVAGAAWQPVRRVGRAGYDVEVGTFEAVPGLPVAAHVYRPAGDGPFPAVVHVPGHWMENARLEPDLQRTSAGLARAGLLVLVHDPVGQGERRVGWHQHGQLAPLLTGVTTLGVMVAETIGALDVLAARPDVDPARLGVAGASGGGYVSAFVAALDPRVAAAAVCCILNTHLGQLRDAALGTGWDGWVDLCNQVPRLAATASMGQVLAASAPCDVTVVHAVDDPPFPVAGARAVVAEAAGLAAAAAPPGARAPGRGPGRARPAPRHARGGHRRAGRGAGRAGAAAGGRSRPARRRLRGDPRDRPRRRGAAQTHLRGTARLPGEALAANVDTNGPIVALARRRRPWRSARRAGRRHGPTCCRRSAASRRPTPSPSASSTTCRCPAARASA